MWRAVGRDRERLALVWGLAVGLFIHCVNFLGVTYFGQVSFAWYLSLGAIISLSEPLDSRRARAPLRRGPGGLGVGVN